MDSVDWPVRWALADDHLVLLGGVHLRELAEHLGFSLCAIPPDQLVDLADPG